MSSIQSDMADLQSTSRISTAQLLQRSIGDAKTAVDNQYLVRAAMFGAVVAWHAHVSMARISEKVEISMLSPGMLTSGLMGFESGIENAAVSISEDDKEWLELLRHQAGAQLDFKASRGCNKGEDSFMQGIENFKVCYTIDFLQIEC